MNFSPQLSDTGAAAWKRGLNRRIVRELVGIQQAVLDARALPDLSGGEAALIGKLRERATAFLPLALSEETRGAASVGDEGAVRWYHELGVNV